MSKGNRRFILPQIAVGYVTSCPFDKVGKSIIGGCLFGENMKRERISPELRERVLARDNFTCRYCGSTKAPFHLDHVYPFSKGGETTYENLVTACAKCNVKKHNRVGIWPAEIITITLYGKTKSQEIERNLGNLSLSISVLLFLGCIMAFPLYGMVWQIVFCLTVALLLCIMGLARNIR